MKDNELAEELKAFLNRHLTNRDVWNKTKTGQVIKEFCLSRGNFKNRPRGNPAAGLKAKNRNALNR